MAKAKSIRQQLKNLGLKDAQIVFLLEIALGSSNTQAYSKAYPKAAPDTARKNGSRLKKELLTRADVAAWLDNLKKPEEKAKDRAVASKVLSIEERREWLTKLITTPVVNEDNGIVYPADKLKALDILNKMDSAYVQKSDVSGDIKLTMGWGDDPDGDSDS